MIVILREGVQRISYYTLKLTGFVINLGIQIIDLQLNNFTGNMFKSISSGHNVMRGVKGMGS